MPWIWVSAGSNIDREKHIRVAIDELRTEFGGLRISPIYETASVGFDGAPFWNLVIGFATDRPPAELHALMRDIEARHGRERNGEKFAPRTLDLDVLTYGDAVTGEGGKVLPRDEILKYAFVLAPLADVAGDEKHPQLGETYGVLWQRMAEREEHGLRRIDSPAWMADERESLEPPPRIAAHAAAPARVHIVVFVALIIGYVVLGLAGLQLQSAQTGVTPVWPASGLAFAVVYWFGFVHLLALLPAMLALAWLVGIPAEVAAISALGSMLEAGVPVLLMRRIGLDPHLGHLRDVIRFVGIGAVLGPVFSATLGTLAFVRSAGPDVDALLTWLFWWLGNSVGFLVLGGFGLVAVARRSLRLPNKVMMAITVAIGSAVVITLAALVQLPHLYSPLMLYLLIPVFVATALRGDQYLVMSLGVSVIAVLLLSAPLLHTETLRQDELGLLYLEVGLLWIVVFTGMVTASARREMREREQMSWLASHDPLTQLSNRHAFMEHLERLLAREPLEGPHVLMYLDLDRFKELNDAEGHRAGDNVLRDVGALLAAEVRSADVVARLGGDEFAMVLEKCSLLDACAIAENVRDVIERYEYAGATGQRRIEVSIGLLELNDRHQTPEDALHKVDDACYEAKRAGRNRVWVDAGNAA